MRAFKEVRTKKFVFLYSSTSFPFLSSCKLLLLDDLPHQLVGSEPPHQLVVKIHHTNSRGQVHHTNSRGQVHHTKCPDSPPTSHSKKTLPSSLFLGLRWSDGHRDRGVPHSDPGSSRELHPLRWRGSAPLANRRAHNKKTVDRRTNHLALTPCERH